MDDAARRAIECTCRADTTIEPHANSCQIERIRWRDEKLRDLEAEREQTISKLLDSRGEVAKALKEITYWHGLAHQYSDEVLKLRQENDALATRLDDMTSYRDTCQRQLDVVDDELPRWKGTGRGRIETIRELRTRLARVEGALQRAHYISCATVRDDGSCLGCFVSAALTPDATTEGA